MASSCAPSMAVPLDVGDAGARGHVGRLVVHAELPGRIQVVVRPGERVRLIGHDTDADGLVERGDRGHAVHVGQDGQEEVTQDHGCEGTACANPRQRGA